MNLVLIIIDYCLLQFDALKFFLGMRLLGVRDLFLTLLFSMLIPTFFNEIVKFTFEIVRKQIFATSLKFVWEFLDVGILANARF